MLSKNPNDSCQHGDFHMRANAHEYIFVVSYQTAYQDLDSITQSEPMRMMNDNSKDEEIQVGNYLSYIPTESVHRPGHA